MRWRINMDGITDMVAVVLIKMPIKGNGHVYGRPRLNLHSLTFRQRPPHERGKFQPLPQPTGPAPFHLDLQEVIPSDQYQNVTDQGRLIFHTAGDLGGIKDPVPQERVAQCLEEDFLSNPSDKSLNPAFFMRSAIAYTSMGRRVTITINSTCCMSTTSHRSWQFPEITTETQLLPRPRWRHS
jgi:hypothetical protein